MNKSMYKWGIFLAIFGLLLYNAVYFEKLSAHRSKLYKTVDFEPIAKNIYSEITQLDAPSITSLQQLLLENRDSLFYQYGNRLGIGNSAYLMAKIEGTVVALSKEELQIKSADGALYTIGLNFIFGNAIRDASKLVKLTDYKKTAEFNALSEALNAQIREIEIPKAVSNLKVGENVVAKVAFKLGKQDTDLTKLSFLPVTISKN